MVLKLSTFKILGFLQCNFSRLLKLQLNLADIVAFADIEDV